MKSPARRGFSLPAASQPPISQKMMQTTILEPSALCYGGDGQPLAGGWQSFTQAQVWRRGPSGQGSKGECLPVSDPRCAALLEPRQPFAGLAMSGADCLGPVVMGIVNVTPDSFSDGGERFEQSKAIDDALAMWEAGARIIDVGGESTRPGADPVSLEEELRRTIPVVQALAHRGLRVSIDTRHAKVMAEAAAAGAAIINDVTALTGDPASLAIAAKTKLPVVLMHMQGEPKTMQKKPHYRDVLLDILGYFDERIAACEAAGIEPSRIAIDPGIGFGKTLEHNLTLLKHLAAFHSLGCPVLLGASRKSFIGRLAPAPEAQQRLPGSLAVALAGFERGIQMIRVHDVAETVQALAVWQAIGDIS